MIPGSNSPQHRDQTHLISLFCISCLKYVSLTLFHLGHCFQSFLFFLWFLIVFLVSFVRRIIAFNISSCSHKSSIMISMSLNMRFNPKTASWWFLRCSISQVALWESGSAVIPRFHSCVSGPPAMFRIPLPMSVSLFPVTYFAEYLLKQH